jgi:hypothetical protein
MLTIALPTFNNSKIIWLQLESLCRQVNAPEFELIVCEEESENTFGIEGLNAYIERLQRVGCKSVKYLTLDKWIPLGQKWVVIRDNMDKSSVGMCLFASDNFSPNNRLEKTFEAFKKGADWVQWKSGYFYNILNHDAGLFTSGEDMPSLFMAISSQVLPRINTDIFPIRSVDTWLYRQTRPRNVVNYPMCTNGVHTDGFNTISHHRRAMYGAEKTNGTLFTEASSDEVFNIFPNDIQQRLITLRNEHSINE